jgi:hypothetical protein
MDIQNKKIKKKKTKFPYCKNKFSTMILIVSAVTTTFYTLPTFREGVNSIGEEVLVAVPTSRSPPSLPSHPT